MKNILIINAHTAYPFSAGKLNATLTTMASEILEGKGYTIRTTTMDQEYDIEEEIVKHLWADTVILQTPVNWMGVPWTFKKYMDDVYTAGMDGRLCSGDGRSREDKTKQYGSGGALLGKSYMISLTYNAPEEAFDNPDQQFFQGKGHDELFWPMHLNFQFFGMQPLKTFACYDVLKNPDIENDFERFTKHLEEQFSLVEAEKSS